MAMFVVAYSDYVDDGSQDVTIRLGFGASDMKLIGEDVEVAERRCVAGR